MPAARGAAHLGDCHARFLTGRGKFLHDLVIGRIVFDEDSIGQLSQAFLTSHDTENRLYT